MSYLDRRGLLAGALALTLGCAGRVGGISSGAGPAAARPPTGAGAAVPASTGSPTTVDAARSSAIADLERVHGGRLGVATLDLAAGRRIEHRATERFPFCSTCKTLAVAATLRRVDLGQERLDRAVAYTEADLRAPATITRPNLARGAMTIAELCKAAIEVSDSTAANLLFREAGGLDAINAYLRALGDVTTRMDRPETELNTAIPGDPRDTTSPHAMVDDLQRLMLGDALRPASRDLLIAWHLGTTTGKARLRAGIPVEWKLAHKTGTGGHAATNDVGIAWPTDRAPLLIAVYYIDSPGSDEDREAVIAAAARIACA